MNRELFKLKPYKTGCGDCKVSGDANSKEHAGCAHAAQYESPEFMVRAFREMAAQMLAKNKSLSPADRERLTRESRLSEKDPADVKYVMAIMGAARQRAATRQADRKGAHTALTRG